MTSNRRECVKLFSQRKSFKISFSKVLTFLLLSFLFYSVFFFKPLLNEIRANSEPQDFIDIEQNQQ